MLSFSARVTPFKLSFVTDADEATVGAATNTNEAVATINVPAAAGGDGSFGTSGFSLAFTQVPCA